MRAAAELGVGAQALDVSIEPSRLAACYEDCGGGGGGGGGGPLTLWDLVRPVNGGLLIQGPSSYYCTLGFSGYSSSQAPSPDVFLTAGHCNVSGNPGSMDSTVFGQGQPNWPRIGREFLQPTIMPASDPHCDSLPAYMTHCTFADALVGKYDSTIAAGFGVVEKTALNDPARIITGLTGTAGQLYGALTGDTVYMVGGLSATRKGVVTQSCVNTTTEQDTTLFVVCASRATYCSASGDSGAPVFMPFSASYPTPTPRAVGINFAGYEKCGGSFYSSINQVENAVGYGFLW